MRSVRLAVFCLASLSGVSALAAATQPVNPHATPEARALLAAINDISGKGIVTGQHNYPNDGSRWTDLSYDITGKYPGLFGEDFGFSGGDDKDSALSRPATVQEIKRQWANGSLIAMTWHAVRPTDDEPVTFRDSVQGHLTDYEWHELLTPGTPLYNRWCEQVDAIAGFLSQLRDAHVPVLFRPYHEVNGNWFWWGYRPGKDGSAALYRQLYHRFVDLHHLDNLVWVWNVNAPGGAAAPIVDYYPGAEYADVVTMDIYGEFKQEYYDSMLAQAGEKPIALAEVGAPPSLDVLAKQPRWAYFMVWSGFMDPARAEQENALYHAPVAINRDDARLAGPMEAIRKATAERTGGEAAVEPVSPGANGDAKALLARLAGALKKAVLSGQQSDPAASDPAAAVATEEAKRPAIYSTDLDVASPDAVIAAARKAHDRMAAISLAWRPARPTDGGAAKGQLTDFEWGELLTTGSDLNKRWTEQADAAAKVLRALQDAGIAVLWNPYPESTGKDFWWAGRKGIHGSAALYRLLFERLVEKDGLHNLVWVWEEGPPSFGPGANGSPNDYFPGLLYTDALELRARDLTGRFPVSRFVAQLAVGKPIGVDLTGGVPAAEALGGWAWFILAPGGDAPAVQKLLADPRVAAGP